MPDRLPSGHRLFECRTCGGLVLDDPDDMGGRCSGCPGRSREADRG